MKQILPIPAASFLVLVLAPKAVPEEPQKVVRNIFHSTFDTPQLGQAPGTILRSTFDTEKLGSLHEKAILTSTFDEAVGTKSDAIAKTSFEDGISPEVFQWADDGPVRLGEGGRSGKKGVGIQKADTLLSTHRLPAEPGAWYEMSVWYRGMGQAKTRVFDGARWIDSVSPPGNWDNWQLARTLFLAAPPPQPKKGAKIVVHPRAQLSAAFGLQGQGSLVFDDFKIARFNSPKAEPGKPADAPLWLSDQMELGEGLDKSRAARVRNGRTLSTRPIPAKPGDELVVRFYYRGLGSIPSVPQRVTHSACAGRFQVDVIAGGRPPQYWGCAANLLLSEVGQGDSGWKLVTVPMRVPAKLWGRVPEALVLRVSSAISTSAGFDYNQTGDVLIDEFSVCQGGTASAGEASGDALWHLPAPKHATLLGPAGRVEIAGGEGTAKTRAVRVRKMGRLTSYPMPVKVGDTLDIGWYYRGLNSTANRAELSRGTRGCGRLWLTLDYENQTRRDTGVWSPMSLTLPEKPDTEWKYSRVMQTVTPVRNVGDPKALTIQVAGEVTQNFIMRGELLLDALTIRRLSPVKAGATGDRIWLGVPDTAVATRATGMDSSLEIVSKQGVKRSRAIRLEGRYLVNSLPVPVQTEKSYRLSLQYRIIEAREWRSIGAAGGTIEVFWADDKTLNERHNITYLKAENEGQPDKDWRPQEISFKVPAQTRSKVVPSAARISLTGYGTVLIDEVRLDEME